MTCRIASFWICTLALVFGSGTAIQAQPGGTTTGADIIVGDLNGVSSWGEFDDISAFSVGTTSCNIGDANVKWESWNNQHPVIGQNMYRISGGVCEQIGQSWLKHGFLALTQSLCSGPGGCSGIGGSVLGVGCSDPYTSSRNGNQSNLGPRSLVDPSTAFFPFPYSPSGSSNVINKRLQVPNDKFISGSEYWVDGQYVSSTDTDDGNGANNVSVRRINIIGTSSHVATLIPGEATYRQTTMIERWADMDSEVAIESLDTDGRVWLAHKVLTLEPGLYQYEYAIYNQTSDDSVGGISIPIPADLPVISTGFSAPHSHSGEPYTNDEWTLTTTPSSIAWEAETNNAIRWGTQYNFRLVTTAPPVAADATMTMYTTGDAHIFSVQGPSADFIQPISGLACSWTILEQTAALSWANGELYDSIEVFRDGVLLDTLPGDATGFQETGTLSAGVHEYSLRGLVSGELAYSPTCEFEVADIDLVYVMDAKDATINYADVSGTGSGGLTVAMYEATFNPGYPNNVEGFSFALTYDTGLLEGTSVSEGTDLSPLVPDFFNGSVLLDGGVPTGGITVGCVLSFTLSTALVAATEQDLVDIDFAVVAPSMAGDLVGATTPVFFENGVHGSQGINAVVTVGLASQLAVTDDATVSLVPVAGGVFARGDANADGGFDIADPVYSLNQLFASGPAHPCDDSADANDDGTLDISDPIFSLSALFSMGTQPPAPSPGCGIDPTMDPLTCDSYDSCP